MKFIFVRHGESAANAAVLVGMSDSPLTAMGFSQARETGKEVRKFGITKIICSPYPRARQTAETIAEEIGLSPEDIETVDDLRERGLGDFEGKVREHDSPWYYEIDNTANVEPRQDLLARSERALAYIKRLAEHETVLVVAHGVSGFYLLQVAAGHHKLEDFDETSHMGNAGYVEVEL